MKGYHSLENCGKYLIRAKMTPKEKDVVLAAKETLMDTVRKNYDGGCVVDVGCGPFTSLNHFTDLDFETFIGIDVSKPMISLAYEMAEEKNVKFTGHIADLNTEPVPVESRSADLVINCGTLPCLHSIDNIFAESARVVKKDGYIVLSAFAVQNIIAGPAVTLHVPTCGMMYCYTITEILRQANNANCMPVHISTPKPVQFNGFTFAHSLFILKPR